jgi:uncharacterized protein
MIWISVLVLALAAGTIGGLIGFGSSIILMPALVLAVGPHEAIPIMAIAGLMANISRVAVWWREVEWRVAAAFSLTAIPMSALGARMLVALDDKLIQLALGVFFLALIPARRWLLATGFRIGLRGMALVGAGIGFLAGLVTTVGPINTPFFLAYGLVKGPFVSTEALASASMGLARASVFHTFGILPSETLLKGLLVGSAVTVGSWLSKQLMAKIDLARFHLMMDGVLLLAAITMLASAF